MPKFFFDFRDGGCDRGFDSEGLDLIDAERAKREAMVAVTQIIQLEASGDDRRVVECRVRDSKGAEVYSISLGYQGRWAPEDKRQVECGSVSRIRH